MTDVALPVVQPIVYPETEPFWNGLTDGTLMLPRCELCSVTIWYPRSFCPVCGSTKIEWFRASGEGTVYSFTVCRRGSDAYKALSSYILAYVELDEGPRLMTNIVDCSATGPRIGDRVTAVFQADESGHTVVRFRPSRAPG